MSENLLKLSPDEAMRRGLSDFIEYAPDTAPIIDTQAGVPIYDPQYHHFAQVILYEGAAYDPHGGQEGSICHYRSIALGNGSMASPHPDYIDVDMRGRVLRSWNEIHKRLK